MTAMRRMVVRAGVEASAYPAVALESPTMTASASRLFDASVDQVRRGQIRSALDTLLRTLALDPGHEGALEAATRICRMLGSEQDARLFEALAARPGDAEALFDLAYRLVDQGRPELAVPLLERCLEAQPDEPAVLRELAFARLQSADFKGCLRALAPLEDSPELSETERLEVLLTEAEAAFYAWRRDLCRSILGQAEELVPEDDQRERLDALHAQLGRSSRWDQRDSLGLREWHFIQHAGVILKTAGGFFEDSSLHGRYDVLDLRADMVAFLLQRLLHLLERLGLRHETIIPVSETAGPLAHALALRAGLPCCDELTERGGRPALLVAANAAEFGPISAAIARHRAELRLFSLNLDWEHDAVVCPEVVGVLARRVLLPWETRYSIDGTSGSMREVPGDPRPAGEVGSELNQLIDALPDDGGQAREEFEAFYSPLADQLVLGNEELYPSRRRFTPLSPCGPSPVLSSEPRDES
jgi:tetratricopeptide (TPR) repeat protein